MTENNAGMRHHTPLPDHGLALTADLRVAVSSLAGDGNHPLRTFSSGIPVDPI
jgi:hypothetical protein